MLTVLYNTTKVHMLYFHLIYKLHEALSSVSLPTPTPAPIIFLHWSPHPHPKLLPLFGNAHDTINAHG